MKLVHKAQDENEENRGHWWRNVISRVALVGYLELWNAHVLLNSLLWIIWLRALGKKNSRTEMVLLYSKQINHHYAWNRNRFVFKY